jgi:hypothetical protein
MKQTLCGLFFLSLLFLPFSGRSQNDNSSGASYILVIPFSPQMYKNPGDHLLCQANDMNPGELNDMIRRTVAATMITNLSDHYHTKGIANDNLHDPKSELGLLYAALGYKTKNRKPIAFHKGYPPFKLKQLLGPRHLRWGSDCVSNDFKKPFKRRQYMEAYVKNDSIFSSIMAANKSAFIVVVTQFEMYTRFKNCLDLQHNVYQRDIYIHFTLLDSTGKKLHGGIVGATYQSNTNDIEEIMEKNLGELCGYIIDIVRKEI